MPRLCARRSSLTLEDSDQANGVELRAGNIESFEETRGAIPGNSELGGDCLGEGLALSSVSGLLVPHSGCFAQHYS